MHKILIIEDETLSANRLNRMLLDIDDTLDIVYPISSVEEVVDTLRNNNTFDLIISDIRLKERLVFEAFNEIMPSCPVIFTTAYDKYALKAFQTNGIDYLLKPIGAEELSVAYRKAERMSTEPNISKLQYISKELKCFKERLLVAKGDELVPLKATDISFIHTENNYVTAHTYEGDYYRLTQSMIELENALNPDLFFRINRQYIIHIDSIRKISLYFNNKLCVKLKGNDDIIIVSKEKSLLFRNWLNR